MDLGRKEKYAILMEYDRLFVEWAKAHKEGKDISQYIVRMETMDKMLSMLGYERMNIGTMPDDTDIFDIVEKCATFYVDEDTKFIWAE